MIDSTEFKLLSMCSGRGRQRLIFVYKNAKIVGWDKLEPFSHFLYKYCQATSGGMPILKPRFASISKSAQPNQKRFENCALSNKKNPSTFVTETLKVGIIRFQGFCALVHIVARCYERME